MSLTNAINQLAPAQAMWGFHLILPAGSSVDAVSSGIWDGMLQLSDELDAEQLDATEAQAPIHIFAPDKPRDFSVTLQISQLATGQPPVVVIHQWMQDLGKSYYFFLGTIPLSTSQFILKSVEFSFNYSQTAADGSPLAASVTLSFAEDTVLAARTEKQQEEEPSDGPAKEQKAKSPKAQNASKAAKKASSKSDDFNLKQFISDNNL